MPTDKDYTHTEVDDPSKVQEIEIQPSTMENIDVALYDFIEKMDIYSSTNKGFKKVPIIWTSAGQKDLYFKSFTSGKLSALK